MSRAGARLQGHRPLCLCVGVVGVIEDAVGGSEALSNEGIGARTSTPFLKTKTKRDKTCSRSNARNCVPVECPCIFPCKIKLGNSSERRQAAPRCDLTRTVTPAACNRHWIPAAQDPRSRPRALQQLAESHLHGPNPTANALAAATTTPPPHVHQHHELRTSTLTCNQRRPNRTNHPLNPPQWRRNHHTRARLRL